MVRRSIPHPATELARLDSKLDDELSDRPLELDPSGYFIIKIDRDSRQIVAEFYRNIINKNGEGAASKQSASQFWRRAPCGSHRNPLALEMPTRDSSRELSLLLTTPAGLACDPETGEVIPCRPGYVRPPSKVYRCAPGWGGVWCGMHVVGGWCSWHYAAANASARTIESLCDLRLAIATCLPDLRMPGRNTAGYAACHDQATCTRARLGR